MSVGNGLITRPVLDLDDLDIVNDTYDVMYDESNLLDIGSVVWRRQTVESPDVPGRMLTSVVKDVEQKSLRIEVSAGTMPDLQDAIGTLLDAVFQSHYQLRISFASGDVVYRWHCEPADVNVGFTYQHVLGLVAPVTLLIPCSPLPVAGPI